MNHEELLEKARNFIKQEANVVSKLPPQLGASVGEAVQQIASSPGRLIVSGAGTSAYIAGRFAHLAACCEIPAFFLHPSDSLHGASGTIKPGDVVFLISKGGETAEINSLAKIAKARNAKVVVLTSNVESTLAKLGDLVLCFDVEGADPFGVLAMGSSLANAAVTDAICVLLLEQAGFDLRRFGIIHPGGAVGHKLSRGGLP
jgi:arabinose-5-phosphate isomerase